MQGAQKTEAELDYVSILPNFSRQIPQDSNKSASARQGPLTLQVCSISQIWEQELHLAQGDQKPRQKYSAAVKMDLHSNSLNNPVDVKAKLFLHFLQVLFSSFHFLKEST